MLLEVLAFTELNRLLRFYKRVCMKLSGVERYAFTVGQWGWPQHWGAIWQSYVSCFFNSVAANS